MTESMEKGCVDALCVNGRFMRTLMFDLEGPRGDVHSGMTRKLSGHDSEYLRTSSLRKGSVVFNARSWTALSSEEVREIEQSLGCRIPVGCLLENIRISGIRGFSKLEPMTRFVFPMDGNQTQAILTVSEENGPCATVGERLADVYHKPGLQAAFVKAAQGKRGSMGYVYSPGRIWVGDTVLIYPPVR